MLDIKRIRKDPEALVEAMRKRRNKGADVTELLALDAKRRELLQQGCPAILHWRRCIRNA